MTIQNLLLKSDNIVDADKRNRMQFLKDSENVLQK